MTGSRHEGNHRTGQDPGSPWLSGLQMVLLELKRKGGRGGNLTMGRIHDAKDRILSVAETIWPGVASGGASMRSASGAASGPAAVGDGRGDRNIPCGICSQNHAISSQGCISTLRATVLAGRYDWASGITCYVCGGKGHPGTDHADQDRHRGVGIDPPRLDRGYGGQQGGRSSPGWGDRNRGGGRGRGNFRRG